VDNDRTTSVPRGVDHTAAVQGPPTGLSAPPAEADRTPPAPNANTAAPGTDAAQAFANKPEASETEAPKLDVPVQRVAVQAPDETIRAMGAADAAKAEAATAGDAAKADITTGADTPKADSASGPADAAKGDDILTDAEAAKVMGTTETARDTHLNNPRHGELTEPEEVKALPKAGQVNNHSSTALEKDSGR
jgi:hypothetical protein